MKSLSLHTFLLTSAASLAFPFVSQAEDALLGDWLGAKTKAEEHGIEMHSILSIDSVSNVQGGLREDETILGNYDFTVSLDTEKAGLWDNGTFFTYVLGNFNTDGVPTEFVGDLQASDNIEAAESIKLYEAWYEHSFSDDAFGILFGLHDYNSEFDALEYAGGLINSSFGISPDISQVGPSIFSTTSVAARVRYSFLENGYVLAAVYDGVPGNPNNPRGTHIKFSSEDGIFYATEIGVLGEESDYYKLGLGSWYHTAEFEDFLGNMRDENGGVYLIGEKKLFSEVDVSQGLGMFAQLGFAQESRNAVDSYVGIGLQYTGLIEDRDEDTFSIGVARAQISGELQQQMQEVESHETAIEANYRIAFANYFALTPDIQWIINPGATKGVKDALVLGVRAEIEM